MRISDGSSDVSSSELLTHMVMGPTCGLVLADLGAEVIKIEPVEGDRTRHLLGAGAGFFPMFNRIKKSIGLNLHTPEGVEIARKLVGSAAEVAEKFRPRSEESRVGKECVSKCNYRVAP